MIFKKNCDLKTIFKPKRNRGNRGTDVFVPSRVYGVFIFTVKIIIIKIMFSRPFAATAADQQEISQLHGIYCGSQAFEHT